MYIITYNAGKTKKIRRINMANFDISKKSIKAIDKKAYVCYNRITPKGRRFMFMVNRNKLKRSWKKALVGWFLVMITGVGVIMPVVNTVGEAYADPVETTTETTTETSTSISDLTTDGCKSSLGEIGWYACPITKKVTEATDWLYEKIQGILAVDPIETGSPIHTIWDYCRGLTNIVFIIFLLVVIYSQITGVGISNYGIKKVLPKMIMVAILVNLSFLICQVLVDASNIIGASLRGVFTSVEQAAITAANGGTEVSATEAAIAESDMYSAIVAGSTLTILGGVVAFETGAIWMLIPMALGALVAVVTGLITIALRQAVVALLVMISPLAMVAYMLPNTEKLFQKWKKLLQQMLVFYPMFSLLFGASSLAGFAIIASATDGFGVLLGTAVQIFPLFFSWKMMKMSGTFLGDINTRMRSLAAGPLARNRAWASSHRDNTRAKMLASGRAVTPSLRLMQFVSNRKVAREAETAENAELAKNRGLAYRAGRNYDKNGVPTRRGERAYLNQARSLEYQQAIERDKNNMDKGLGQLAAVSTHGSVAKKARLDQLDNRIVRASDNLKIEQARGEKITYENAESFHNRMDAAINAHFDDLHAGEKTYRQHEMSDAERASARARYAAANRIMEGNLSDIQFAAANAAHGYDTQKKIIETKMGKYFDMTPPSKDLEYRLTEMTKSANAAAQIDSILPGLKIMNQRGDTDEVRRQVENILNSGDGIQLGTHASQALASFLMFDVKDSDPFLRRFGKYINLETAQVYNKNKRQNARLSLDEYVTGEYEDWDAETHARVVRKSKKGMTTLLEGTPLDNLERTAFDNVDEMIRNAYTTDGKLDVHKYLAKREELEKAIGPAFISSSLKYLSGSEQLKNAVTFLTGYKGDTPRWQDEGDALYGSDEAEPYFRRKTMEYLKSQTPVQIFGLRSDYYNPLMEHLSREYEEADTTGWSAEAIDERNEYMRELAEVQTRYGDLPAEEAQQRREADRKALKDKLAGAQFRQILDSKGVLGQIYETRKSGAANGAKHWVRGWLDLDNEVKINRYLGKLKSEQKQKQKEEDKLKKQRGEADAHEEGTSISGGFDETDRATLRAQVEQLWNSLRGMDGESFYRESVELIRKELQGMSGQILKKYEEFYKDSDGGVDKWALKNKLDDLVNDPENYK